MLTNQYTLAAVRAQIIDYLTSWNLEARGVCLCAGRRIQNLNSLKCMISFFI